MFMDAFRMVADKLILNWAEKNILLCIVHFHKLRIA